MPRQLRVEMAGAHYHVMARGDRREAIFLSGADREDFLGVLGAVCQRHGWRKHASVLMVNQYHLLLATPQPNLVGGMSQLQQTYSQRFNRRHRQSGHLFGGRYKAVLVESDLEAPEGQARRERSRTREVGDYFTIVADYIHLNPVRAGLVSLARSKGGKGLMGYAWSSLVQAYARPLSRRASWMKVGPVLAGYDQSDSARGRYRMINELEAKARAQAAEEAGLSAVFASWWMPPVPSAPATPTPSGVIAQSKGAISTPRLASPAIGTTLRADCSPPRRDSTVR